VGTQYDANSNRESLTTPGGTVSGTYDAQDRLLTYGNFAYTYGPNGELTSRTNTATSDVTDYVYDARGSLLSVNLPDTTQIDYVIDGQARRVGKKINGVITQRFLYKDGLRIVAELDAAGEMVSQFMYVGGNHSPDYMVSGGAAYRFVKDQVGSVRLVINTSDGGIAQRIDYDAYGVVLQDTNPGFQPFGFAGGLYDADTGFVRFGARDYDASVGRWTAKDPIRFTGGINLYAYSHNDPVNSLDPAGRDPTHSQCVEMAKSGFVSCSTERYSLVNAVCETLGLYDRNACANACAAKFEYDLNTCELTAPLQQQFPSPPYQPENYEYPFVDQRTQTPGFNRLDLPPDCTTRTRGSCGLGRGITTRVLEGGRRKIRFGGTAGS
jgi:RHS repeat-associated protein